MIWIGKNVKKRLINEIKILLDSSGFILNRQYAKSFLVALIAFTTTIVASYASDREFEDEIKQSGNYHWAEGFDEIDISKAERVALVSLIQDICIEINHTYKRQNIQTESGANHTTVYQCSDITWSGLRAFSIVIMRDTDRLIFNNSKPLRVLSYIYKDSLAASLARNKIKIHDMFNLGVQAETEGRIGDALRIYYWTLLNVFAIFDTLCFDSGQDDPQTFLIEKICNIISNLDIMVGDCFNEAGVINVPLKFFYRNEPVQDLVFTYFSGISTEYGFVRNGKQAYVQLYSEPDQSKCQLPLNIEYVYKNQMRRHPVIEELHQIFDAIYLNATINVEIHFPWNGGNTADLVDTSSQDENNPGNQVSQDDWSLLIQILSSIKDSHLFCETIKKYERLQKLTIAKDASMLQKGDNRVFAALLNEKDVAGVLYFDGKQFTDVCNGTKYNNLEDEFSGYHIIWIGESTR